MKILIQLFFLIILSCNSKDKDLPLIKTIFQEEKKPEKDLDKISKKADDAFKFCKSKKMNTDFCVLIDMSLHSGVNRFYVWDFKDKKIVQENLVGHGCGENIWSLAMSKDSPKFSNEDGSHLSSLGKYKIGERGYSDWGIHVKYLLYGLDETNSNALKRYIVLHSWNKMSNEEVFPNGSPEGWGCPTISNEAMQVIDKKLKSTKKPVLMWIFN